MSQAATNYVAHLLAIIAVFQWSAGESAFIEETVQFYRQREEMLEAEDFNSDSDLIGLDPRLN
jgi:hypothetical protein